MKYYLVTLVALANAASISGNKLRHHDGTFYEEYNVGGHSHDKSEGPRSEYKGPMPDEVKSLGEIFADHDDHHNWKNH